MVQCKQAFWKPSKDSLHSLKKFNNHYHIFPQQHQNWRFHNKKGIFSRILIYTNISWLVGSKQWYHHITGSAIYPVTISVCCGQSWGFCAFISKFSTWTMNIMIFVKIWHCIIEPWGRIFKLKPVYKYSTWSHVFCGDRHPTRYFVFTQNQSCNS